MKSLNAITLIILIIGGLNWLLVGLFQFDLVAQIFGGEGAILARIVYVIVGICALYALTLISKVGSDHRKVTT